MQNCKKRNLERLLPAFLAVFFILFSLTLFKHISYPLLWNDEGDTAMFATRILEYGFPKVHDGKNVLYVHTVNMSIGVNKHDMYTADLLLTYYWAAPGAWLASKASDIYDKTLLFRLPFALTGLLGVIVMALAAAPLFKERPQKTLYLALYFLFAVLSVSLALHLREARYYSPIMLFSACLFYAYVSHRFLGKLSFKANALVTVSMLLFIYHSFFPLYIIFIAFVGLYETIELLKKMRTERAPGRALALPGIGDLKYFLPLIISAITIIPFVILFRTVEIIMATSTQGGGVTGYIEKLLFAIGYFAKFEFLYLALFVKAFLAGLVLRCRFSASGLSPDTAVKIRASNFLTLFFIVHVIAIAGMPYFFTRYFLVLLPVLAIILILDSFSVSELLGQKDSGRRWQRAFLAVSAAIFLFTAVGKAEDLRGRVYELAHQYKGPLDYAVTYIRGNYERPEDLVIATNYEEAALMYYLGSRVTVGHAWNNLQEDLKVQPDIIIYRDYWSHNRNLFQRMIKAGDYEKISLEVLDYPVNNIPDLHFLIPHLYRTPIAEDEAGRLKIYVRRDNPLGGAQKSMEPSPFFPR